MNTTWELLLEELTLLSSGSIPTIASNSTSSVTHSANVPHRTMLQTGAVAVGSDAGLGGLPGTSRNGEAELLLFLRFLIAAEIEWVVKRPWITFMTVPLRYPKADASSGENVQEGNSYTVKLLLGKRQ